tara:strand:- start:2216 stop:3259 length:1044 start_codon:yes stop_codon:yes gene_type:complete
MPILFIFTILLITLHIKQKHPFWDNQPVMRYPIHSSYGVIGNSPKFNIKLKPNQSLLINKYPFDLIRIFLQNNFSNHYNVDPIYLDYIFHKKGSYNITLLEDKKIIGFIHSSMIPIQIDSNNTQFQYVDYLCIHPKYRDHYMATILIAAIVQATGNPRQPILFKKDYTPLPYAPVIKSYYFIKDLRKLQPEPVHNITTLDIIHFYTYFEYTNALLKRYKIHRPYSKNEFFEIFLNKKVMDYFIINNSNNLKTIVIGKKNSYQINNMVLNCFEIEHILGELRYSTDIHYNLSHYLKTNGYNYICIPNIAGNIKFIRDNKYVQNSRVYYYTYNYNLPNINIHEFCVNIN